MKTANTRRQDKLDSLRTQLTEAAGDASRELGLKLQIRALQSQIATTAVRTGGRLGPTKKQNQY